jgi:hypothetical protein
MTQQINLIPPTPFDNTVNDRALCGFFSNLYTVVGLLLYNEAHPDLTPPPNVYFNRQLYGIPNSANWWNDYFEPISNGLSPRHADTMVWEHVLAVQALQSHEEHIFASHIKPLPQFEQEAISRTKSLPHPLIGVHLRKGLKTIEGIFTIDEEFLANAIKERHPNAKAVLLTTDEEDAIEPFRQAMRPIPVICYPAIRSQHGEPVHLSGHDTFQVGREALLDALAMKAADALILTTSGMSRAMAAWNPQATTWYYGRPYNKHLRSNAQTEALNRMQRALEADHPIAVTRLLYEAAKLGYPDAKARALHQAQSIQHDVAKQLLIKAIHSVRSNP